MKRRIRAWAETTLELREALEKGGHPTRMVMVLLTYRRAMDYKAGHINLYMKDLKRRLGDGLISFAWVAEMQRRGAVHYHLILLVHKGTSIPLPDKSGMWSHGLSGIHTARSPWYLVKYVGKEYQKDFSKFPKGCRTYAASIRDVGNARALYRWRAGLVDAPFEDDTEGGAVEVVRPKWEYLGSAVTEGYAREVLVPAYAQKESDTGTMDMRSEVR